MHFQGRRKFTKFSNVLASFTKTSKFQPLILHKQFSIILEIRVSQDDLDSLKSVMVLPILISLFIQNFDTEVTLQNVMRFLFSTQVSEYIFYVNPF